MQQWRYPFAILGIAFLLVGYAFWPRQHRTAIIVYHGFASTTQPADSYAVETALLTKELEYLKENGYAALTFNSLETLRKNGRVPEKAVVLAFDDALPSQYSLALPLLVQQRMTGTFFIASDLVGDGSHMDWNEVRALSAQGMEIGGHSANHAHIAQLNETGLQNEIGGDKRRIENEIGKTIRTFAYPYGERNASIDSYLSSIGYVAARMSNPAAPRSAGDLTIYGGYVVQNSFESFLEALGR